MTRARKRRAQRGQGLVEFALVVPLMMLLAVALGDYGRLYTAAITVESAAREAADFGAMQGTAKWDLTNGAQIAQNVADMKLRACTAASTLSDYAGPNSNCSVPSFSWAVERLPGSGNCSTQGPYDDPCIIRVTITYQFHMFLSFAPLPPILTITRESRFAISDLGT